MGTPPRWKYFRSTSGRNSERAHSGKLPPVLSRSGTHCTPAFSSPFSMSFWGATAIRRSVEFSTEPASSRRPAFSPPGRGISFRQTFEARDDSAGLRRILFCAATEVTMKRTLFAPLALAVCLFPLLAFAQTSIPKPPDTPRHPVTDEVQGVKVTDDYRWLENWDDPAVKQWSAAQNARTREYLDHLPERDAIRDRLKKLVGAGSA